MVWGAPGRAEGPRIMRSNYRSFVGLALGAGLALILATGIVRGQVVINEVLADNRGSVSNGEEFPDYVELFNASSQAVNLGGMSLTDDAAQPRKFVFPANAPIGARGYVVVWCDKSTNAPGWHTGFGLGNPGDQVMLYAADGATRLDSITFGLQLPDHSIGRVPDATRPWTLSPPTPGARNVGTPMGTGNALKINEWMADDLPKEDWLEIYNGTNLPLALEGLVITDSLSAPTNRAIPSLSFIGANGFVQLLADDLALPGADHLDFKLSAAQGETLTLYARDRATVIDRVTFGAQVAHVSQGRLPDGGEDRVSFPVNRATPGASNFLPLTNVVINELLTHTDPPLEDAVELYNPTSQDIDLGNWYLSNSRNAPAKYRIPANTILPAGGFRVFYEAQFNSLGQGFTFNSYEAGEAVLSMGNADGKLTGYILVQPFGPAQNGVSLGRFPTSQGFEFTAQSELTFGVDKPQVLEQFRSGTGKTNAYPKIGPLIINEIMYHPTPLDTGGVITDNKLDEYVELFNPTLQPVPLFDPLYPTNSWRVRGGISYDFPLGLAVAPQAYLLLVGFDPADAAQAGAFRQKYQVPAMVPVYGPYHGNLDNRKATIELFKPDPPQPLDRPKPGLVPYILVDKVAYADRDPWPDAADGKGFSLQRSGPDVYGNEPVNWVAAAPSAGRKNNLTGPRLESWERAQNGGFGFRFTALAGVAYAVEYLDSLPPGSWNTLTNFTAERFTRSILATDSGGGVRHGRFYRVRLDTP